MKILGVMLLGLWSLYGQPCVPARILPAGTVKGTLDDSSCRLTDGSVYTAYRMDLATRGQIRIELSTASDLFLILRDSSGMKVESGMAIRRAIEAGSYTLLVNGRTPGQSGDFTVQTRFAGEPGLICTGWASLGLNQAADGVLGSSGCTLPDGTPYESYLVTTFGAGTLSISVAGDFAASVIVRGAGGSAVASGSGEISVPVDRGSPYQVVVHGDGASGAYRVVTRFQPDDTETCRVSKTLSDSARDTSVVSLDSCTRALPNGSDLLFYNYYSLTVAAAGLADLQVSSSDFEPSLNLLDEAGNLLASDSSEIRMQLAAGNYTLQVVSSIPSGGTYDLNYQFTAGRPEPCSAAPLKAGDSAAGAISSATCRSDIGPADQYSVTLAASGTLDAAMSSSEVAARIAIRDAKDNLLALSEDAQGTGQTRVSAELPAGLYYVVAGTGDGAGFYQLTSQFTAKEAPPCSPVARLDVNTGYVARLGPGSCVNADGQPVDYFDFTLTDDSIIAAVMTSTEVDGYLSLLESGGTVLRSDDNSYGFGDPLILQFLPAGSYRIAARAASSPAAGYYRVDLLAAAGPRPVLCGPRGNLALDSSVDGKIHFGSCQYPDGTFADIYRLELAADTSIDLLLTSKDFDAALILLDGKGNTIDLDDDGGGGSNARITHMLAAGTYFVVAKGATDYTAAGGYTLALAPLP